MRDERAVAKGKHASRIINGLSLIELSLND